jgi:hypothetical protein
MLIDTGADITMVPSDLVKQLGISIDPNQTFELMGFDGTKNVATAVKFDLLFLGRAFKGRFFLLEEDTGILGRDVLSHLSLLFDGPHLTWSEHP